MKRLKLLLITALLTGFLSTAAAKEWVNGPNGSKMLCDVDGKEMVLFTKSFVDNIDIPRVFTVLDRSNTKALMLEIGDASIRDYGDITTTLFNSVSDNAVPVEILYSKWVKLNDKECNRLEIKHDVVFVAGSYDWNYAVVDFEKKGGPPKRRLDTTVNPPQNQEQ
ncbi:exported hypothetical protein [Syntrophobacter sp. SbD1]|nr:exported hypothetical protein [Syntrophobacter sp. SbD1]